MTAVQLNLTRDTYGARRSSTRTEDVLMASVSVWIVVAIHLDGRAHFLELPDSFFTWWHLLMYSGAAAAITILLAMGVRRRDAGQSVIASALRPPRGYGAALVGAAVFTVGGAADMGWHSVFGIETGVDALLSPPHLVLMLGAVLLFSGPILASVDKRDEGAAWGVPALASVAAVTAVADFATIYSSAFSTDAPLRVVEHFPEGTPEHYAAEVPAALGLASFVLTTLILVVPLAFLLKWRPVPLGTATVGVAALAALAATLNDFQRPWVIVAAGAGAFVVDIAIAIGMRRLQRWVAVIAAVTTPLAVWSADMVALHLTDGVRWPAELVAGSVLLSALLAAAVANVIGQAEKRPDNALTKRPEPIAG